MNAIVFNRDKEPLLLYFDYTYPLLKKGAKSSVLPELGILIL